MCTKDMYIQFHESFDPTGLYRKYPKEINPDGTLNDEGLHSREILMEGPELSNRANMVTFEISSGSEITVRLSRSGVRS